MAEEDDARNISMIASLQGLLDSIKQTMGTMRAQVASMMEMTSNVSPSQGNYTTSTPFPDAGASNFGLGQGPGPGPGRDYYGNYVNPKTSIYNTGNYNKFLPGTTAAIMGSLGNLSLGMQQVFGMVMPSPEDAMYTELLGQRMSFYGGSKIAGIGGAYGIQNNAARMGTPTSSMDTAYASNVAASAGLLPGLGNYQGSPGTFGGVMGGAALFSNLSPGVGLQGGMGAVAALNQARSVNRLRMIGINVRSATGEDMVDVSTIIDSLYEKLQQAAGGSITEQDIAISAMSGNAIDSILNQYFSGDPVLRQSVLAGLIQKAKTGGKSIAAGATKENLISTGGMTNTINSLAARNANTAKMTQAYATPVNEGTIQANDVVQGLTGVLTSISSNSFFKGVAALQSFLEVLAGAGGGAGAGLIGLLTGTGGDIADIIGVNKAARAGLTGEELKNYSSGFGGILTGIAGAGTLIADPIVGKNIPNPASLARPGGFTNPNRAPIIVKVNWDWSSQGAGKR